MTAMAGFPTDLHLFVAARGRASHPALKTVLADSFAEVRSYDRLLGHDMIVRKGRVTDATTGHPEVFEAIAKGMWISHLSGAVSPDLMRDDLVLSIGEDNSSAVREWVLTSRAYVLLALLITLGVLALGFPVCALIFRDRKNKNLKYAAFLVAAIVLVYSSLAIALPVTGKVSQFHYYLPPLRKPYHSMFSILSQVQKNDPISSEARLDRIRKAVESRIENPFEDGPIREEASPGNYTLSLGEDGEPELNLYNEEGWPMPIRVSEESD
jgi:hypothetical protein